MADVLAIRQKICRKNSRRVFWLLHFPLRRPPVSSLKFSKLLLYADDAKASWSICSPLDCSKLQRDLNFFVKWSTSNGLPLNTDKYTILSFSRSPCKVVFDYYIQGKLLSRISSIRDLGVIFDDYFSFRSHIESVCSKAVRTLGFIKRALHSTSDEPVSSLTFTNPLPLLY